MSFKQLQYRHNKRLPCVSPCGGVADVILCITAAKVAPKNCPLTVSNANTPVQTTVSTDFSFTSIEAQVINFTEIPGGCGTKSYLYTFQYDDSQIAVGANLLYSDILGVLCDGCLTSFIKEKAGNDIFLQRITPEGGNPVLRLVNQHGCRFEFTEGSNLSEEPEQAIITEIDGIFVNKGYGVSLASNSTPATPGVLTTGVPLTVSFPTGDLTIVNPSANKILRGVAQATISLDISFASDSVLTVNRERRDNGGAWVLAGTATYQPGVAIRLPIFNTTPNNPENIAVGATLLVETRLVFTKVSGGATTVNSASVSRSFYGNTTD